MRAYSLSELFNLTRHELFTLHARIVAELPVLAESDYAIAFENLRRIRRVLAHPRFAPSRGRAYKRLVRKSGRSRSAQLSRDHKIERMVVVGNDQHESGNIFESPFQAQPHKLFQVLAANFRVNASGMGMPLSNILDLTRRPFGRVDQNGFQIFHASLKSLFVSDTIRRRRDNRNKANLTAINVDCAEKNAASFCWKGRIPISPCCRNTSSIDDDLPVGKRVPGNFVYGNNNTVEAPVHPFPPDNDTRRDLVDVRVCLRSQDAR